MLLEKMRSVSGRLICEFKAALRSAISEPQSGTHQSLRTGFSAHDMRAKSFGITERAASRHHLTFCLTQRTMSATPSQLRRRSTAPDSCRICRTFHHWHRSNRASVTHGQSGLNRASCGMAVVSHYNVAPVIDIFGAVAGRDLGGVAGDINKIIDARASNCRGVPKWLFGDRSDDASVPTLDF